MADSQSIASSTAISSSLHLPQPSPARIPPQELFYKGRSWQRVEHAANKRRGVDESAIWDHGTDYVAADNDTLHAWRCLYCHKTHLNVMKHEATSNALRHLRVSHGIGSGSTRKRKRVEEESDIEEQGEQVKGIMTVTNVETFRYRLTRWMVNRHISFVEVEDDDFRDLLKCLNPSVKDYLVKTGNSIRDWVEEDFIESKRLVREVLARSISKIHISCDLWTSPNGYAMCGIAAHFIGHQGHVQSVLLALKRMTGAHKGDQIAEVIIEVVRDFDFVKKLGVYIGDNADSNDTAWRVTLAELHPDRDPEISRSRCLGHIINLAAKAFIFGKNVDAFEAIVDSATDATPWDAPTMRTAQSEWRKKGALGKIHNIVIFIRISPQRKEAFRKIHVGDISDDLGENLGGMQLSDLNVICDNNTRWNSTYLSLQRALKLRERLELFCFQYKADLKHDTLTEVEWRHLDDIVTGLQPFHEVTLVLEGLARHAHFGAIWEALPALAVLMERMEVGLRETTAARTARDPLAIAYQNAWEKLKKYYSLTDDAHSIYAAAILLHPSHRKQYFDYHWTGEEEQWKDKMIKTIKTIWEDEYKPLLKPTNEQPQQQPLQRVASMVELFLRQAQMPQGDGDEFDKYINGPPTVFATPHDCIPWLRSQQNLWPGITQHALDLLSIPAMSAELERVFSQAKRTITSDRNALGDHTIEILELMSYWWRNNIISQPRGRRQRQE